MAKPWRVLEGADFTRGDKLYGEWLRHKNGHVRFQRRRARGVAAVTAGSARARPVLHGAAGRLQGLFPAAIRAIIAEHHDYLTWAVLKAHTNNRAGEVTLRSANPRDTPLVNFHYFEEGSDKSGEDLKAVVTALRFVRQMTQELKRERPDPAEELPGDRCRPMNSSLITCVTTRGGTTLPAPARSGRVRPSGVLDSRLRVHGVERSAHCRRLGVSAHSGLLHRRRGLHGGREGGDMIFRAGSA